MTSLFGTDGIRGRANVDPMTVDNVLLLGRAFGAILSKKMSRPRVVIGKDTRLSCYMFEHALTAGLSSMGADVFLIGPIPTPAVSHLVRTMRASAGIVISASHNPHADNGLKFFGPDGFKLSDEMEKAVQKMYGDGKALNRQRPPVEAIGHVQRLEDARGRYIEFLKQNFEKNCDLEGLKIVLDCANGAAYKIAPIVFDELGADVEALSASPNGTNINDRCGALHPQNMCDAVLQGGADLGLAFDGDADRLVACDHEGNLLDGDDLLAVFSESFDPNELSSGVVGTIMSNEGLNRFFSARKIPFFRSQVGDRHVVEMMKKHGSLIGGETSGHLISLRHAPTGDGILAGILTLAALKKRNRRLAELRALWNKYPQFSKNLEVGKKVPFDQVQGFSRFIESIESRLEGKGRMVLRYSGTEDKIRIMIECLDESLGKSALDDVVGFASENLGRG